MPPTRAASIDTLIGTAKLNDIDPKRICIAYESASLISSIANGTGTIGSAKRTFGIR
jgi:hypothetical protein